MGIKTENIKVNLLFGADTSTAVKNVKQLG
jgi:hypothetical protein